MKGRKKKPVLIEQHPLYNIWACIKQRCNNPNHTAYKYYGGRGIKIHSAWSEKHGFISFMNYVISNIGDRPSPKHSIDRYPNKDGNYEPGNIRWANTSTQANNRNKRHSITPYNPDRKNHIFNV